MISIANLSVAYGGRQLFNNLTITFQPGQLSCLTGPNGAGKSSLLAALAAACVDQKRDHFLLSQHAAEPSPVSTPGLERARKLIVTLRGLPQHSVVLLDEPSNHLDRKSFDRFCTAVCSLHACLLIVTHDRRLLRLADRILHLEDGRLYEYGGNFELYQEQRTNEGAAREREWNGLQRRTRVAEQQLHLGRERQQKRRRKAQRANRTQRNPAALINYQRNRADRTDARIENKHRQRMENLGSAKNILRTKQIGMGSKLRLARPAPPRRPARQFAMNAVNVQHDGRLLWRRPVSLVWGREKRLAITGANGSGKTTMLLLLAGKRPPDQGRIYSAPQAPVLITQNRRPTDPCLSLQSHIQNRLGAVDGRRTGKILHDAGLPGVDPQTSLSACSGGELIRLELTLAFQTTTDLLLLDEPTNDMDARSRCELIEVLQVSSVPWVCVSHDEEFLHEIGVNEWLHLDDH
ncbi:MAG: ABC-F family ATP-binding cassette domain-containing protein [Leptospiraceae bacterium]|nr:ABC-F family ATP-binding cassette domain-containing protein [Leptospiraceae bacterium]